MKPINIFIKVILTALLVMPIFGILGFFPEPTADMYTNETAFQFIQILMASKYIMVMEVLTFAAVIYSIWSKREALASLLLLPFTFNIVGFHAFIDGGLLTGGAVMGNILLAINLYLLYTYRAQILPLFQKRP
jgi:hypothetical protein